MAGTPTPKPNPDPRAKIGAQGPLGAVQQVADQARGYSAPVGGYNITPTGQAVANAATGLTFLPATLTRATFWQRAGVFALGIALIWVGIIIYIGSNKTVQSLAKTAIGGAVSKTPAGVATNLATGALA